MDINEIIKKLKENNYRITGQRKTILEVLDKHQNQLLTIDQLLVICQEKNSEINASTIYRNIDVLDELQLLYKININRNTTAYKFICGNHHHHHIRCVNCGKLEAIDYCPISDELLKLVGEKAFTLIDHDLELFGLCNSCSQEK